MARAQCAATSFSARARHLQPLPRCFASMFADYRPTRAELEAGPTVSPEVEAALAAAAENAAASLDEVEKALKHAPASATLPAVLAAAAAHAAFVRLRLLGPDATAPAEARPHVSWSALPGALRVSCRP